MFLSGSVPVLVVLLRVPKIVTVSGLIFKFRRRMRRRLWIVFVFVTINCKMLHLGPCYPLSTCNNLRTAEWSFEEI
jgi:hypothetical protein